MVCVALAVASRIALLLSLVGFLVAQAVALLTLPELSASMPVVLGYNLILTTIAVGGVWFVPSVSALVLAFGAALLCGLVTLGLWPILADQSLPLLALPFNLTVSLVLCAVREREANHSPRSAAPLIGTPEQNLGRHHAHYERLGTRYRQRFVAPFLGRWTCTQGVDGQYTHQGPWRHAFDFEVRGADGKTFEGSGRELSDYRCFRLPVVAAADGIVASVVSDIEDNPVGQPNLQQCWGNLVLLCHAPAIYSMVCHLARGSARVAPGQAVRRGQTLGLCGSSGRSSVPHLHFQLQASPLIGAPTLPVELHDVVTAELAGETLHSALVVTLGEVVRNLESVAHGVGLPPAPGERWTFEVTRGAHRELEVVEATTDPAGAPVLRSHRFDAWVRYEAEHGLFRFHESRGDARSVLHALCAALPIVPLELGAPLSWSNRLRVGRLRALWVDYRSSVHADELRVLGEARRTGSDGAPVLVTLAELCSTGMRRVMTSKGAESVLAERISSEQGPPSAQRKDCRKRHSWVSG